MAEIVASIVIHARNKALFKREEIDINDIIKRELEFFALNPEFKYKIEKKIELSDDLPRIPGNPIHIKQIVDNILKNAIDSMENSPEKCFHLETCVEDKAVLIRISDTGEGIEKENIDKIFSPDFTTKAIGKGTGLGLASVKTMVEAYSGDIRVQSKKGKGTTFVVKIPVARPIPQN